MHPVSAAVAAAAPVCMGAAAASAATAPVFTCDTLDDHPLSLLSPSSRVLADVAHLD